MSTFWLLVMSHTGCLLGGVFIARNPETIKGWLAAGLDRLKKPEVKA